MNEEAFTISLIHKWKAHRKQLAENMDLYMNLRSYDKYDTAFSNWNTVGLMIWDLEDILCRKGFDLNDL